MPFFLINYFIGKGLKGQMDLKGKKGLKEKMDLKGTKG
jgi:hypothetical protein